MLKRKKNYYHYFTVQPSEIIKKDRMEFICAIGS